MSNMHVHKVTKNLLAEADTNRWKTWRIPTRTCLVDLCCHIQGKPPLKAFVRRPPTPPYRIYMQGRAVWTGMNYGVIRMPRRFGHGCLLDGPILGHNSDLLKIKAAAVSRESFLFYLTGTKGLLRDTKIVPKSHKWAKRRKESRESIKNACISQQPLVLDGPGKGKKLC